MDILTFALRFVWAPMSCWVLQDSDWPDWRCVLLRARHGPVPNSGRNCYPNSCWFSVERRCGLIRLKVSRGWGTRPAGDRGCPSPVPIHRPEAMIPVWRFWFSTSSSRSGVRWGDNPATRAVPRFEGTVSELSKLKICKYRSKLILKTKNKDDK